MPSGMPQVAENEPGFSRWGRCSHVKRIPRKPVFHPKLTHSSPPTVTLKHSTSTKGQSWLASRARQRTKGTLARRSISTFPECRESISPPSGHSPNSWSAWIAATQNSRFQIANCDAWRKAPRPKLRLQACSVTSDCTPQVNTSLPSTTTPVMLFRNTLGFPFASSSYDFLCNTR
jgi:hypothetical protein